MLNCWPEDTALLFIVTPGTFVLIASSKNKPVLLFNSVVESFEMDTGWYKSDLLGFDVAVISTSFKFDATCTREILILSLQFFIK